ncbi:MAG: hypothetical protein ABWY93_04285 [Mycobacterium sp.]
MNVLHYLDFGSSGADALIRQVGLDDAYGVQGRLGVFTAEHHLRYYAPSNGPNRQSCPHDVFCRGPEETPLVVHARDRLDPRRPRNPAASCDAR